MKMDTSNTSIREIRFNGSEKAKIRDYVLKHAGYGSAFLELYGNGDTYILAKKLGINILSIDDGRDFKNGKKLKIKLKGKDKMFISLYDLCNSKMKRKNDVIWLDYCGAFNKSVQRDMLVIPNILKDTGVMFITLLCGRENFLPKGTIREIIDESVSNIIKKTLKKAGLKTVVFFKKSYLSKPNYKERKKIASTRMIVYGLKWSKI